MAVYKVIQDIEAEDKLIGPLTLKGFIYAATAVLLGFINFRLLMSPVLGPLKWVFVMLFFFPMLLFGVLASPLGREQPTEVWLLARIRFMLKPRTRIWNQLGIQNLVVVTAQKKADENLTKGLTQTEVTSRLQALAQTLDSRGWSVKNSSLNLVTSPSHQNTTQSAISDRLASGIANQQDIPVVDVHPADDILDEQNNPTAQKFEDMMRQAEEDRREALQEKMQAARNYAKYAKKESSAPVTNDPETQAMLDSMHERAQFYATGGSSSTPQAQTVKLELAQSGNALSVASIAKLANQAPADGEVVVPLQ